MRELCRHRCHASEEGFTSAQFLGLIALTLIILSGVVNILLIEYSRQAVFTAANEAARAGTQSIDFRKASQAASEGDAAALAEIQQAEENCNQRLLIAVDDMIAVGTDNVTTSCQVVPNADGTRYSMQANFSADAQVILWAAPFKSRLTNLSATYEQRQAAQ